MIVVTGGAGFIGYNLVKTLIDLNYKDIVVVDNNISRIIERKHQNITYLSVEDSYIWLGFNGNAIKAVFHLGARTDTTETNTELLKHFNTNYSKFIWQLCTDFKIPLIYASSAAVYGDGEQGFNEAIEPEKLMPLNQYGWSKLDFDAFALQQEQTPPSWFGLRFFNVYGCYEDHKGRMASVVWHLYNQIKKTGEAKLFKSHHDDYTDGNQMRDFIYVTDIINFMIWLMEHKKHTESGIYNMGTGKARTFNDLAKLIFENLDLPVNISYIYTPMEIRESYQYFTEADMGKLHRNTYIGDFMNLESGIHLYIKHLENEDC